MLTKLWAALQGSKTYILAILGIVISLVGHFWGPIHVGSIDIPQLSWNQVWDVIWNGGLFAALRHGISNSPSA